MGKDLQACWGQRRSSVKPETVNYNVCVGGFAECVTVSPAETRSCRELELIEYLPAVVPTVIPVVVAACELKRGR